MHCICICWWDTACFAAIMSHLGWSDQWGKLPKNLSSPLRLLLCRDVSRVYGCWRFPPSSALKRSSNPAPSQTVSSATYLSRTTSVHFHTISSVLHPFPLVAEAECADSPGLFAVSTALHLLVHGTQARLTVLPPVPDHQHVGQVRNIAGRQAQRFDLGEFSVHRFRWDQCPQRREGRVDVLGPVSLPSVGGVPLPDHHTAGLPRVTLHRNTAAAVALVGAAVALAAVPLLVVRHQGQVSGVREGMCRHRPQHSESHHG